MYTPSYTASVIHAYRNTTHFCAILLQLVSSTASSIGWSPDMVTSTAPALHRQVHNHPASGHPFKHYTIHVYVQQQTTFYSLFTAVLPYRVDFNPSSTSFIQRTGSSAKSVLLKIVYQGTVDQAGHRIYYSLLQI